MSTLRIAPPVLDYVVFTAIMWLTINCFKHGVYCKINIESRMKAVVLLEESF
jgi:hypothetical protein